MTIQDEIEGVFGKITARVTELEEENSVLKKQIANLKGESDRARANFAKEIAAMISSIHARFGSSG